MFDHYLKNKTKAWEEKVIQYRKRLHRMLHNTKHPLNEILLSKLHFLIKQSTFLFYSLVFITLLRLHTPKSWFQHQQNSIFENATKTKQQEKLVTKDPKSKMIGMGYNTTSTTSLIKDQNYNDPNKMINTRTQNPLIKVQSLKSI